MTDEPRYLRCTVCTNPIPPTRKKDSVTCSPSCTQERKELLRLTKKAAFCLYCKKPSTPEERASFMAWRKWRDEFDRYPNAPPPRRRGRPLGSKKKQEAAVESPDTVETEL